MDGTLSGRIQIEFPILPSGDIQLAIFAQSESAQKSAPFLRYIRNTHLLQFPSQPLVRPRPGKKQSEFQC